MAILNQTPYQTVKLATRLGRRALAQPANQLMSLCILVCSLIAASMSLFSSSVQTALDHDIANFLGAPMVLRSDQSFAITQWPTIEGLSDPVVTSSFTTGANHDDSYHSISLKAVSSGYPLQGRLTIGGRLGERSATGVELSSQTAWLDRRALDELNVELGEKIQIGQASFTVNGEILFEPDRLTQLQHALPRVLVSGHGLANTGVAIDNNRGEYRMLFEGDSAALNELEALLPSIISADFDVLKPGQGKHPFSRISSRAERLLNVVLVLLLLMCGGAAATLADHSARKYAIPATVLRCMGLSSSVVTTALCLIFILMALAMSVTGSVIAWLIQPAMLDLMQPHMTLQIPPLEPSLFVAPITLSGLIVLGFVAPKLQRLGALPVSQILRGQLKGSTKRLSLSAIFTTTLVIALLFLSSDNHRLTTLILSAVAIISALALGFGWCLSKFTSQFHHLLKGPLKVAVRSIGRSPKRHSAPLISVAIATMAILMTVTLRGSFLDMLQVQMLETDGNTIFTGLPAPRKEALVEVLRDNNAELKGIYPTVSARLATINGVAVEKALSNESDTREESRSKIRLSWSDAKPANNIMIQGAWPELGSGEVSVEQEVMTDLGLNIGDQLGFNINGETLNTTITSSRKYQGGESRMMFWFMFSADALARFDQRLMGGILIHPHDESTLSDLSRLFPQIGIANLERQIDGIRKIMIVITRLMNTILLLLMGGALMVIIASSYANSSTRRSQLTLMRAFGLSRKDSFSMSAIEQLCIALVASLIGIIGVQAIAGMMFHELFGLSYRPNWGHAVLLTTVIGIIFTSLGWLFTFRNLQRPVTLGFAS